MKLSAKELKTKWLEKSKPHTEAELLRETVEFINNRAEIQNDGVTITGLVNDYLRYLHSNGLL